MDYSKSISYDDYQKLDSETNEHIIDVVYKLYTLGCWIQGLHIVPLCGICFDIKCCVQNKEQISLNDKLIYKMSSQYLKDIFFEQLSYYLFDDVNYMIYKDNLIRGIKAMSEV